MQFKVVPTIKPCNSDNSNIAYNAKNVRLKYIHIKCLKQNGDNLNKTQVT